MSSRATTLSKAAKQRYLAALLSLVTLTAQIASVVHVATVTHVTCAEHGEAVEVAIDHSTSGGHEHATTCLHQAEAVSSHHEHCALAAFRHARSTAASPHPVVAVVVQQATSSIDITLTIATTSFPLFLLAPKNSPPV